MSTNRDVPLIWVCFLVIWNAYGSVILVQGTSITTTFILLVHTGPIGNFNSSIVPTGNFNSSIGPTGNFNSSIGPASNFNSSIGPASNFNSSIVLSVAFQLLSSVDLYNNYTVLLQSDV